MKNLSESDSNDWGGSFVLDNELETEVCAWCYENMGREIWYWMKIGLLDPNGTLFSFKSKEDAILFALRWL
jgi:hypothetical protein